LQSISDGDAVNGINVTPATLQNSVTPTVVGSTADMASSLPLQCANTVCYVGDFSFLPDHIVSDSTPQRNLVLNVNLPYVKINLPVTYIPFVFR
jgi:hypothetical protein